jgi:imidazolonepropionase-like amidohydrolase
MGDLVPPCDCLPNDAGSCRIADGVTEVRKAVREEIRLGANQIKVLAGGGVGSEADPLDQLQYSMEELEAIVDEATRSKLYVMAHVYTDEGIRRCIEAGIRTIEHGHFLGEDSARMMAERGMYLSPNFIVYKLYVEQGKALNYPEHGIAKAKDVYKAGGRVLDIARRAGVKVCFSTDLTKSPELQAEEFLVRAEMEPAAETIRSATTIGAEVVQMEGKIGVIAEGAFADLIAVDGNPLENLKLLAGNGAHLSLIMKAGTIYKNRVST